MPEYTREVVVGIDLGTSNSVGFFSYRNGPTVMWSKPDYIGLQTGDRIHPSYVMFKNDGTTVVGKVAKDYVGQKPVAFNAKRLLARPYNDPEVQVLKKKCGLPLVQDKDGNILYDLSTKTFEKKVTPKEVYAEMIKAILDSAKVRTEGKLVKVCFTVPVNFNEEQRMEVKEAALSCDLSDDQIVLYDEPSAAVYAHVFPDNILNQTYLVFDVGDDYLNFAIVRVRNGIIQVLRTGGNSNIGGNDLTRRMMDLILAKCECEYSSLTNKQKQRLWKEAEGAKENLSETYEVDIPVEFLTHDDDDIQITRDEFEQKINIIVNDLITQMDDFLSKYGYSKDDIAQILFVGGCTRVPLIKSKVEEYFGVEKIDYRVQPDTCVAEGATLYAIQKIIESETTEPKTTINPPPDPRSWWWKLFATTGAVVSTAVAVLFSIYSSSS